MRFDTGPRETRVNGEDQPEGGAMGNLNATGTVGWMLEAVVRFEKHEKIRRMCRWLAELREAAE